jgi:hypothetical protein
MSLLGQSRIAEMPDYAQDHPRCSKLKPTASPDSGQTHR